MKLTQKLVFEMLGRITVFYATLDLLVSKLYLELILSDKASNVNDTDLLPTKFKALKSLKETDVVSVVALDEIKMFADDAISLAKTRNRFLHDQWVFNPNDLAAGEIRRIKLSGIKERMLKTESCTHSYQDLEDLLKNLGEMQEKVGKVLEDVTAHKKALS